MHAEISDDKIKIVSNRNLKLEAKGICKDIIFKSEEIKLNTYYYLPGKFNLVKYGIIYCDIIQEQIFGEDYRQVLQIITLDNN